MKVILNETVSNLGTVGDIVTVKNGYGRNYLLPKGLAVLADPKQIKVIEHHKRALEAKRKLEMTKAEDLAKEFEGMVLTYSKKTSDQDHIFGSVTSADIEKSIIEKGFSITRKQIVVEKPIKNLGEFKVTIKLNGGFKTDIKVVVEKEEAAD